MLTSVNIVRYWREIRCKTEENLNEKLIIICFTNFCTSMFICILCSICKVIIIVAGC